MYNDLIFFKCTIYYPNAMVIVFFFLILMMVIVEIH